jgi:hypothetical protein
MGTEGAQFELGHDFWRFTTEAVTTWVTIGLLAVALVTSAIAVYAALIALRQVREARVIARNADAQDSFRSYLEVCLNHPDLAYPNYEEIKKDDSKLEQYEWFVAYLLAASEKILAAKGADKKWIDAIKLNIRYHRDYLSDKNKFLDEQFNCYRPKLCGLITEETGRKAPTPAVV